MDRNRDPGPAAAVAAESLPPPWPGAPVCACCTRDPVRRAALERLRVQRDRLAVCRWLDQLAPLTVCYGPRRLRRVGLAQLLAEGRWVA
jgi:hypothetical protein